MAPSLWNCPLYRIWFFFSFLTSVVKDPAEEPCCNFECVHLQTWSQSFRLCNKVCPFSYVTSLISSVISTTLINNFFNKTWAHVIHFNKTRALPLYFDFIRVVSDYNGIHQLYFCSFTLEKFLDLSMIAMIQYPLCKKNWRTTRGDSYGVLIKACGEIRR